TTRGPHAHAMERHAPPGPRDTPDCWAGGAMPLINRMEIDIGIKHSAENGLRWAAAHGLHYVDFRLDTGPEAFDAFIPDCRAPLGTQREAAGVSSGLNVHPGTGHIDFRQLFRRIEQDPQFHGHYMCTFGSLDVMLTGRAYLAQEGAAALG